MKKQLSTKKALIASILTLCMCFAMLIGTTFAWFTDSVTSSGNVIKTGTLEVGFYWSEAYNVDPAKAEWKDASAGAIFNNDKWEPGYTEARHLKIVNEGTLALRYKLAIIPHGEVSKLADVIDVYVINGAQELENRNEPIDQKYYVGSLREFIGTQENVDDSGKVIQTNNSITAGKLSGEGTEGSIYDATIVLKMQETAGNEYQNLSIGSDFSIQLLATQVEAEDDSFGSDYDKNAYTVVNTVAELRSAINAAVDTTTIFVQPGDYTLNSMLSIEGKSINIVGLGVVNIKMTANQHMFTIQDSANHESKMNVTIKNINLDGNNANNTKGNIFMVKYNVTLNLENVITKNAAGSDICIDNANPLNDNIFYDGVTTTVNLENTDVYKVSMDTVPVVASHVYSPENPANYPKVPDGVKTYAYLNYNESNSSVAIIEKQSISKDATTMYVNGDNSDPIGYVLYANDDASLNTALNTIHSNSVYYGKTLTLKLAAGEYDGDYVINQYPEWNGERGHGNTNNPYNAGVTADTPVLNLTITGETVKTYARAATEVPAAIFTGTVTVNGFGNSMTGFATSTEYPAPITFKNVAFKGVYDGSADFVGNSIVFKALNAADNIYFDGCYFADATHVTLGSTTPDNIGSVEFVNCNFTEGGCLSGRFNKLTIKDSVVNGATKGFINQQKADATGAITIDNLTADVGAYLVRTNGGTTINISNSDITVSKSEGTNSIIISRGSGDTVKFVDCIKLEAGSIISGSGASSSEAKEYYDEGGATYYDNIITGETVLNNITADAPETFVVPDGVDIISSGAFAGSNVTTVVIPESVISFGGNPNADGTSASGGAFKGSNVETIVLPEGLTEIPAAAFNQAGKLKNINIPASVTSIGINAFQGVAIENLVIPATVTNIGYGAFRGVQATTIIVEGNPTVANYAFRGCPNLTDIYFLGDNVVFTGTSQVICRKTDGTEQNLITVHVQNRVIANRIDVANSSTKGHKYDVKNDNSDTDIYVGNDAELLAAINNPVANIHLLPGTYSSDYTFTSPATVDIRFVAEGDGVIFTGLIQLGLYERGTFNVDGYRADITFEGITFHQATANADSISIQNVGRDNTTNALTLKNCTIINNGEYGVRGVSGGAAYNTRVIGCDFINSAFQPHGNGGTGLVIDDCDFVNAYINVQAGNGVTVQNSRFESTITTEYHNNGGFYCIRNASNGTPITVTNCTFAVDSTVVGVGVAGANGWAVFVNRGANDWTVTNCQVTMTDAALAQPALGVTFCKSTGKINMTNVTVNGGIPVATAEDFVEIFATIQANGGGKVVLIDDITVTDNWDSRPTTKIATGRNATFTVPVEIDGLGHTLTFTSTVDDKNCQTVFFFENDAVVKNLNFDMSAVFGSTWMRAILSIGDLEVDNCTFIGSDNISIDCAIMVGFDNNRAQIDSTVVITNSTFTNWKRGVSDNMNAKEVESITVSGCTFNNASAVFSAYKSMTFTNNKMFGSEYEFDMRSYTAAATATAVATGNTFDGTPAKKNIAKLDPANVIAQEEVDIV